MAKFSVELGAMFNEIANKICEALKSGYETIDNKTEQIKQLREDIRNERTEIGAVDGAVMAFATTAMQVVNDYKHNGEDVDNLIDILNDIEDCTDYEVGACANCGTLLMESDEPYYEDSEVFCDEDCANEYHRVGECENCGLVIYDRDDYLEDDYGLFCCDECHDECVASFENTEDDNSNEDNEPEEIYND